MTYNGIRTQARSGDVFLVKGSGLVSWAIRALTGESISHVAILVWIGQALWVAEMHATGFRMRPASLWVEDAFSGGKILLFGKAPRRVRERPDRVRKAVFAYRDKPYGFLDLMKVWLSQVFRTGHGPTRVCSGLVQAAWEAAGMKFDKALDPGDLLVLCSRLQKIRSMR